MCNNKKDCEFEIVDNSKEIAELVEGMQNPEDIKLFGFVVKHNKEKTIAN